jgi:hypothetical protein
VDNSLNIFRNPHGNTVGIFCFRKLVFFLAVLFSTSCFSQARLEVREAKKNFGFVKRGELVKNEFEITNAGNEPLLIKDVEISCSCTTVDFPKQPILPGQKEKVSVNFNTTTVYGRQDRVVYLISNDPKSPAKLRYKGTVSNK